MSYMWTADHSMTPEEAVTHLRRSLVGIDWQAVQVLAGEVKQLHTQRDAALALAGELERDGWLYENLGGAEVSRAIGRRLRETLGEKP